MIKLFFAGSFKRLKNFFYRNIMVKKKYFDLRKKHAALLKSYNDLQAAHVKDRGRIRALRKHVGKLQKKEILSD